MAEYAGVESPFLENFARLTPGDFSPSANCSASNEEDTMKHSMLWTIPLIAVLAFLPLPAVTAAGQDDQQPVITAIGVMMTMTRTGVTTTRRRSA